MTTNPFRQTVRGRAQAGPATPASIGSAEIYCSYDGQTTYDMDDYNNIVACSIPYTVGANYRRVFLSATVEYVTVRGFPLKVGARMVIIDKKTGLRSVIATGLGGSIFATAALDLAVGPHEFVVAMEVFAMEEPDEQTPEPDNPYIDRGGVALQMVVGQQVPVFECYVPVGGWG